MDMEVITEEVVIKEDIKEENIEEGDVTGEVVKQEDVKEEYIKEEDIKKEDIIAEDIKKEDIKEEDIKTEDIKEEDTKEEYIKEEDIKEEYIKEEDIKEEYIKVDDIKEEYIKKEEEEEYTKEKEYEETYKQEDVRSSKSFKTSDDYFDDTQLEKEEVHYISPTSPISPRTENEGDFLQDYMQFLIQPLETEKHVSVSTSVASTIQCDVSPVLQRTMAIIKPDAMEYKDVILRVIEEGGFQIVGKRHVHLSAEQISEIYSKYYGDPMFAHLVVSINTAPVLALSLAGTHAIIRWKKIVGPDCALKPEWFYPLSVKREYGINKTYEKQSNVIHASENLKESNMENRYFYPNSILEPLMTDEGEITDFCKSYIYPTLTNGLLEVIKAKPMDPVMFLADWLLLNNPYQPRLPYHIALTGS